MLDQLYPALAKDTRERCRITGRRQLRLCQIMLAIGIVSVLIQFVSEDWHDGAEDAIEWQLALLLQCNFLLTAVMWRKSQWQLAFMRPEQ